MTVRGSRILVAHGFKSGSARFVALVVFVVVFAQFAEIRQIAAGGALVVILGGFLAAIVQCFELGAVLAGRFHAFGAKCRRHGADGDCEGDCAEGGGVLQQNRVLLGVATARRIGGEVNGLVNALPQFRYVRRKSVPRRGRYR